MKEREGEAEGAGKRKEEKAMIDIINYIHTVDKKFIWFHNDNSTVEILLLEMKKRFWFLRFCFLKMKKKLPTA